MSASFFALFDDIAVLAKAAAASLDDVAVGAAKASAKAAGVVIDDAAVSPQYVQGLNPKRELPVVWKITRGSLINKAFIVAGIMLLSTWAPWVFPWLLLVGGTYLAYEGAEKLWHSIGKRHSDNHSVAEVLERTETSEKQIVSSAVRTDLVLSIEIMLISLANIETDSWGIRLAILIVVAIMMTVAVYGTVALLVKMDDVGFWLRRKPPRFLKIVGTWLVKAMPWVFKALSLVGMVAMLWVGGHILLANLAEVGVPAPYGVLSSITHAIPGTGIVVWLLDSGLSAVFGLAWGAVLVAVLAVIARMRFKNSSAR
ncbi:putative DNA repair protein MutK [Leucobacter exalbidus]|uniref:DNA repair protein MutK n=1 Tax=Leucobacter exalbidus TaxID=662960 RepID=A0A940PR88_9MICO|nr:putative DNA repair protein MutK [Leucobacter exalbidus]